MQRWVSFVLLLAFIRLQLVCCCGSVGICCETVRPSFQESVRAASALSTRHCPCDHDHQVSDVSDVSHRDSDDRDIFDESDIECEITSHDGKPHSQSHYFYLSEQNQSVLAERTDLKNITQPIAYSVVWSEFGNQRGGFVIEYHCPPKQQSANFDLVGHLRI
jgi:hypothetical protein